MIKKISKFFTQDLVYGLTNLSLWFKIIWQDRHWDFIFIYMILRHKLILTRRHLMENHNYKGFERDAHKIKICVLLLDRLIKDDYFADKIDNQNSTEWLHEDLYLLHTPEENGRRGRLFKRAVKHEELLKNQDLDLLFKLLRKHVQKWWD